MDSRNASLTKHYKDTVQDEQPIPDSKLKHAYLLAAKLVTEFGDIYLPIFERLEAEHKSRQEKKDALDRAKKLALKFNSRF